MVGAAGANVTVPLLYKEAITFLSPGESVLSVGNQVIAPDIFAGLRHTPLVVVARTDLHLHLPPELLALLALDLQVHAPSCVFVRAPGTEVVCVGLPNREGVCVPVVVHPLDGVAGVVVTFQVMGWQDAPVTGLGRANPDVLDQVVDVVSLGVALEHQVHAPPVVVAPPAPAATAAAAVHLVGTNAATVLRNLEGVARGIEAQAVAHVPRPGVAGHWLWGHHALPLMVGVPNRNEHAVPALVVVHLAGDFQFHSPFVIVAINPPHAQGPGVVWLTGITVNVKTVSLVVVLDIGAIILVACVVDAVHIGEGLATLGASCSVVPNVLYGDTGLVHGKGPGIVLLRNFKAQDPRPLANIA